MRDANERRGEHFRAAMRSRGSAYALVFGASAGFVVGAWQRNPLLMAALPAAIVLTVVGVCYWLAERRAEDDFFQAFAALRGLSHWPRYEVLPYTPLLGAGDRRRFEHWIEGSLDDDPPLSGGFGRLVCERVQSEGEGGKSSSELLRVTVGVVDIESALQRYHGVFLRPRRGLLDLGNDWLAQTRTRKVELESTRFSERYELRIADDQDELDLRRLFSPSLIAWLSEHPLTPGIELRAGALVVFVMRTLEDDGNLTFFLDAMRHIGARVVAETGQTAAA
jgi:hypothetical protein